ncbi:MAG: amidohydrolase [Ponticaulis sp.]|nr:amidohydrolase [Ponticaulis sp.]
MLKWFGRIAAALLVLTIIGAVGTYIFVRGSVVEMFGGNTQTVTLDLNTSDKSALLIENVNILSPGADRFLTGQSVLIENGLISNISSSPETTPSTKVIDGQGRYLIPGLTDSHVHLWRSENDLLLYIANGVTQVREMHGIDLHVRWRDEIKTGRIGPDIVVIAAQLATYNFAEGLWVDMTAERNVVRSDADVRRTVSSLLDAGYDGLKASSYLSLPGYQAASKETAANDALLVGHLPVAATLDDLWASNQTEVAHVEEFVKALMREFGRVTSSNTEEYLAFVRERAPDVAARVKENGISVTSTLALVNSFADQIVDIEPTLQSVQLEYVNPGVAEGLAMGWLPDMNRYRIPDDFKTDDWEQRYTRYWSAYAEAQDILFKAFLAEDVELFAGTDANVPVMVPGFSLHDELETMQAAGMSPSEVLASATRTPSDWMGLNTGRISEGYKANLVLLRDNPLTDISATREIEMVFANDRAYDRAMLDGFLKDVLDANTASRKLSIEAY